MPKSYEHTFADLRGNDDGPAASVVDLGPDATQATDPTGARLNKPPGNPEAGKPDQFGDVTPAPKSEDVDDGIDLDLDGAAAEEVDGEQGGDDLSGYSKNVRERIERERRMREEAEERSRRTEAELASISRKVDLQGKETEWAQADEKDTAELARLKALKVAALEAGETDKVVDLDDKITDVKVTTRTRDAERVKAREEAKKAPVVPAGPTNQKAKAWIDKHPAYNSDPLFKKAANAADQALNAMGMNSQSDEYYVELTRILAKKFDVDQAYLKGGKQNRGGPRGGGSQGVRGGNGQVRSGSNGRTSVTITKEDKAMLASMGQDVDDPAVLRAYAREKVALQRTEQAARGER